MSESHIHSVTAEIAVAATAISTPWWWAYVDTFAHMILVVGGVVLLLLQIAWRITHWKTPPGNR